MKNSLKSVLILAFSLMLAPVFSQTENDTTLLGLPGDNLDLYATLDLFQKSKTIEDFEKTLNDSKTGINNLDLNLDSKIDFIKVETKQKDQDFTFILQVDVAEKEKQDVAVILVSKDKNDKVTMQIVGDTDLYGKDYIIEPKPASPAVTPNPGYTGGVPVDVTVKSDPTTVVVVESAPIVTYVYSPVYVPYYPPYYYGYYPPYYAPVAVVAVGVYRHNNYYHHSGYHGGYNNTTVVVHNTNNYNNYNNSRNTSNTVNNNKANGSYNGNSNGNKNTNKATTNQAKQTSASKKQSTTPSNNKSKGTSASTKESKPSKSAAPKTSSSRTSRSGGGRRR